ncbi:MAG: hypothetical protein AAGL11_05725 [Pseudomonadota bacterium]
MSEAWIKALSFAALPGAAKVRFERSELIEDGVPTTRYKLQSETESGAIIGDDRDYDLLKAAMGPLESLSEASGHKDLIVELDLKNKALTGLPRT